MNEQTYCRVQSGPKKLIKTELMYNSNNKYSYNSSYESNSPRIFFRLDETFVQHKQTKNKNILQSHLTTTKISVNMQLHRAIYK